VNVDRTTWGRLRVTGGDRVRFLQGLTTVNVEALTGHGWGAILNPKGRVLSVIDIAHDQDGSAFVITCEPQLTDKTRAILERYAVMDDVAFEPLTGPLHQELGDPWQAPFVEGAGDTPDADAEPLRIRAGFLRYGADVDETHFPFETPLAAFLDYGKGCYVGQEPVFRVHAQGNAAKALRGLVIAGDAPIAPGAAIEHAAKANAGSVTSSAPAGDGTTLALAYVHRTAWDIGGTVQIDGRAATIHGLPW
jgi:folate-binding protein YgfZ